MQLNLLSEADFNLCLKFAPKNKKLTRHFPYWVAYFPLYIHNYMELGLDGLKDITNPSLDDISNILIEMDKEIPATKLNAKQAILLATGLINSLKSHNIDEKSFESQIKSVLNTQIYN